MVYKFASKGRAQQITSTCPLATRSLTKTAGRHVFGFVPLISVIKVSCMYSCGFLCNLFWIPIIFFLLLRNKTSWSCWNMTHGDILVFPDITCDCHTYTGSDVKYFEIHIFIWHYFTLCYATFTFIQNLFPSSTSALDLFLHGFKQNLTEVTENHMTAYNSLLTHPTTS